MTTNHKNIKRTTNHTNSNLGKFVRVLVHWPFLHHCQLVRIGRGSLQSTKKKCSQSFSEVDGSCRWRWLVTNSAWQAALQFWGDTMRLPTPGDDTQAEPPEVGQAVAFQREGTTKAVVQSWGPMPPTAVWAVSSPYLTLLCKSLSCTARL